MHLTQDIIYPGEVNGKFYYNNSNMNDLENIKERKQKYTKRI